MRLYKLAYFLETRYFEITGERIANIEYRRQQHGPVIFGGIREGNDIQKNPGLKSNITYYSTPIRTCSFNPTDEAILTSILNKYSPFKTPELRNLTHLDAPYHIAGKKGEPIHIENIIYNDNEEEESESIKLSVSTDERSLIANNLRRFVGKSTLAI